MAVEMESPNYRLEIENYEQDASASSALETSDYETPVLPRNITAAFEENGYAVLTADEDSQREVTFTLSKTDVSFDDANKTPDTDELNVSVGAAGEFGYEIYMIKKDSIFHNSTKDVIPHTQCNDEWNPCTPRFARLWTQESSYGIGFSLAGKDKPADFTDDEFFRPFAEAEAVTIMQNVSVGEPREGRMTIKLNPDPSQPEGTYEGMYELRLIPKL